MGKRKRLSEPMLRVLRNLEAGRSATDGLHGMSEFGGFVRTEYALVRRGLICDGKLTDLGREAVLAEAVKFLEREGGLTQ